MAEAITLTVGQVYRRRDLHESLGGQQQGGISTSATYPVILLFTSESGATYGYHDGIQPDGLFWYTGEGQVSDMLWVRGNRAIRDHQNDGKTLHLFEQVCRGQVRYIGLAEYLGHHIAIAPDKNGDPRKAIVFELGLLGDQSAVTDRSTSTDASEKALKSLSMSELRVVALARAHNGASPKERKAAVYRRSEAIKWYVRKRALNETAVAVVVAGRPWRKA